MRWLFAAFWFGGGMLAASLAAAERIRKAGDVEFLKGWTACLRKFDEDHPEVRRG